MVDAAGEVYSDQLAFGAHAVGFARHWKEEYGLLNKDFEALLAERQKAPGKVDPPYTIRPADPVASPVVQLMPAKDLQISAKATDPNGIKSVRLRYRHLTQFEDYQTADMKLDSKTGLYTASIPLSFVDPKWDLMYFVEVLNNRGVGRMYPDLDKETPYVVLPSRR
jgi:hypothetical protein